MEDGSGWVPACMWECVLHSSAFLSQLQFAAPAGALSRGGVLGVNKASYSFTQPRLVRQTPPPGSLWPPSGPEVVPEGWRGSGGVR